MLNLNLKLTEEEIAKLLDILHATEEKELFDKVCDARFNALIGWKED